MPFQSLGLSTPILQTLQGQEFNSPTPIQEKVIPAVLAGKDVQGAAPTGSGKTASYVLPILELFQAKKSGRRRNLKVLVLVPTRELAIQVAEVFQLFSGNLPNSVKHLAVYGGVKLNQQMIQLKDSEILIATPGRLLDLISTQSIHLGKIEILILDEADKMLDLGFQKEMEEVLKLLPKKRQNLLFSATLDTKLDIIKKTLLSEPLVIEIEAEKEDIELIKQVAYRVKMEKKGPLLRYLINSQKMKKVLVFASSIRTADNICNKLNRNGISAKAIHSKKTQSARTKALLDFKMGEITVLVATDLASRGIDILFLPHVINFELPRSPKDYIHRIGRTGRAGTPGEAISLVTDEEEHHFYIIQKKMGKRAEKINSADFDLGNI